MPVVIKFLSTGSIPGMGDPVQMQGPSLTIGRGTENDLVLPDPDRMLSKRHCAIEDHNGNVVVVDFSTNGTFLNYGKLALGATPTPLNHGDILSVGPYELQVDVIADGPSQQIADPLADIPVSPGFADQAPTNTDLLDAPGDGGDFLDDLLGGRDGPVGPSGVQRDEPDEDGLLPPLGEDDGVLPPAADPYAGQGASAATHNPSVQDHFAVPDSAPPSGGGAIPDDWDDEFLKPEPSAPPGNATDPFGQTFEAMPPAPPAPPTPQTPPETISAPEDIPEPPPPPPPAPTPTPESVEEKQAATADVGAAARAFLKSLGAEDVDISDADLTATMSRMGHVLRIMIEGMREILMTRTSIKSEFRIEQTMIQAGGNNPLKFSINPEQAIEALVKPKAKGYLDATDAAEQALNDIKAHEVAMVTGMESAIKGILARLDPKILEDKISVGGGFSNVLKSKKARYWEIYEEMYSEISDQAENDFHELFAKEFARAYQAQLDKLK